LRVVATHFGLRGGERRRQTQLLLAALGAPGEGAASDAVLMMGDLNEWRGRRGGIPALDRELGPAPAPLSLGVADPAARSDLRRRSRQVARLQGAPLAAGAARFRPSPVARP